MCRGFRCWHDPLSTHDPYVVGEGYSLTVSSTIADTYNGRTVLITGGRGYVGSALAQSLANVHCKLILLDRSPFDAWKPEHRRAEISLVNGDVSTRQTWDTVLPGVEYVFHLAGLEYMRSSEYDPVLDFQCNALPVLHLLEVCRRHCYHPRIVFSSSANLFGFVDILPVDEDNRDDPLIPWAVHKLMAESYLRLYAQRHGIKSIILRLANVYGPTARRSAMTRVVINKMIADAMAGKSLTLYDNHHCVRDYIFLEDVVHALLLAGTDSTLLDGRFYVVGSGEGKSISEVCRLIADKVRLHAGQNVPIHFDASVKTDAFDMRNFVADITRFRHAIGWKPTMRLEQGIDVTIESLMMAGTSQ